MNEPAVWGQNIPDLVQFDFDGHKTTMRQAHNVYGFVGEPSPELIMRWLSIGIYTPFLRNHVDYNHNYREPWIYGKEPSAFTYYEDDGVSYEYEKGVCLKRTISFNPAKSEIGIGEKAGSMNSKFTKVKLILHGFPAIKEIKVNGTGAGMIKESARIHSATIGWRDGETVIRW
jgi:hypothetical protein